MLARLGVDNRVYEKRYVLRYPSRPSARNGKLVVGAHGGTGGNRYDCYQEGSPFELLPLGVRQHLIHGARDVIVPPRLSDAYQDSARARGDAVRLTLLEDAGHFELISPRTRAFEKVRDALLGLLEEDLERGQGVSFSTSTS